MKAFNQTVNVRHLPLPQTHIEASRANNYQRQPSTLRHCSNVDMASYGQTSYQQGNTFLPEELYFLPGSTTPNSEITPAEERFEQENSSGDNTALVRSKKRSLQDRVIDEVIRKLEHLVYTQGLVHRY